MQYGEASARTGSSSTVGMTVTDYILARRDSAEDTLLFPLAAWTDTSEAQSADPELQASARSGGSGGSGSSVISPGERNLLVGAGQAVDSSRPWSDFTESASSSSRIFKWAADEALRLHDAAVAEWEAEQSARTRKRPPGRISTSPSISPIANSEKRHRGIPGPCIDSAGMENFDFIVCTWFLIYLVNACIYVFAFSCAIF